MLLVELERFIEEDLGYNDVSCTVVPDCKVRAEVVSNEDGIVAGLAEATQVFEYFEVFATTDLAEGTAIKKMTSSSPLKAAQGLYSGLRGWH